MAPVRIPGYSLLLVPDSCPSGHDSGLSGFCEISLSAGGSSELAGDFSDGGWI